MGHSLYGFSTETCPALVTLIVVKLPPARPPSQLHVTVHDFIQVQILRANSCNLRVLLLSRELGSPCFITGQSTWVWWLTSGCGTGCSFSTFSPVSIILMMLWIRALFIYHRRRRYVNVATCNGSFLRLFQYWSVGILAPEQSAASRWFAMCASSVGGTHCAALPVTFWIILWSPIRSLQLNFSVVPKTEARRCWCSLANISGNIIAIFPLNWTSHYYCWITHS
jgi:hypothetical protein